MFLYLYIHRLTGRVFKIIPLKEREDNGEETFVKEYVENLWQDMIGSFSTFPELDQIEAYASVLNKLGYLKDNEFDINICRKKVFESLKLLNSIEKALGGDPHEH